MAFKLRQLQYFIAVADTGSISGAAQLLSISQSTVTESVKELEADLGFELVERHGRGVSLTHKGQMFLRHAHRILETVADARRSLAEDGGPSAAGELHVGVTSLVAGYVFSDLLARYRRANPGVTVSAVEDNRDYLQHLLINGELDVAVMVVPDRAADAALQIELLGEEPYQVWLPLGHPLARQAEVTLAEAAREAHIVLTVDEIEETTRAFWTEHGFRPRTAFRTRSVEAVRSLVATGAGITILPALVYRPWSLEGDRIEARPASEPLPTVKVGIAWRKGARLARIAQDFVDIGRSRRLERIRPDLSGKPKGSF
ncbi:LysR family transcriptional regulator [Oharaeibacter diazotrophicus]|uniref:DNA-binding transcriptional LysR family regulator n=1 Tax=Oharaeibacter diazotrophicus TaxID=1920512 RepID=A0A4R6R915_9HYPH|nr:LysR family transcriptional regulator [Oharaeibacter diazotrophicus]TDP82533.1 DNA-binding transcriptional LysR family regulator [Oharaeibacter diazotrophicus]BBE72703.1 hydrogen peroxide-inducible genes activator [Pleomorphomonas sp. SM30]GLS76738.1 LysR family transcriptional regulator [Oharaeibacter diazotrophicus]